MSASTSDELTLAQHYDSRREAVSRLVAELPPDALATRVPGCPLWDVRELVSHLAALPHDALDGRSEGAGSDPWTARQVSERQGVAIPDLLAEWDEWGPQFATVLDDLGPVGLRVVFDATLHEDDLREALGEPYRDSPTHTMVLDNLIVAARERLSAAGAPGLTVRAAGRSWELGEGSPVAALTAPDLGELARALSGRRSKEQLAALDWAGNSAPFLPHLPLVITPV